MIDNPNSGFPTSPQNQDVTRNNNIPESENKKLSPIRSLTRLLIGGVLLGIDELSNQLESREKFPDNNISFFKMRPLPTAENISSATSNAGVVLDATEPKSVNQIRYILIGLVSETQDRMDTSFTFIDHSTRVISNITKPITEPIAKSRLTAPLRNRFESLVSRGQDKVDNWIDTGRIEETHSRAFAETALETTVNRSITYLSDNDDIQELIQAQSIGLAGEIVEEIRERTVSGDNFLEAFFRSIFGRTPRSELPEPPPEIQQKAQPHKQYKGRFAQ